MAVFELEIDVPDIEPLDDEATILEQMNKIMSKYGVNGDDIPSSLTAAVLNTGNLVAFERFCYGRDISFFDVYGEDSTRTFGWISPFSARFLDIKYAPNEG